MARPLIGVSGPDRGGLAMWLALRAALLRAGADAERLTPERPGGARRFDGLILSGGADVDPELYGWGRHEVLDLIAEANARARHGQTPRWTVVVAPMLFVARRLLRTRRPPGIDGARDALELGLLERAVARGLPVLGICRGAQLVNVFFGGTLHPEVGLMYGENPGGRTLLPRRHIRVEPDSRLAAILGTTSCRVNALHHQAVDEPGRGLRIVAREASGIVQGIEHTALPLVLGVQWHPEYLPQHDRQRRLFTALVTAAAHGAPPGGDDR